MANAIVTIKVFPESPEADLDELKEFGEKEIRGFHDTPELRVEEEPMAFGLVALKFTFVMDEGAGNTDPLEESLAGHDDVRKAETVDVRRALG